jgi:hypothetical protein
MTADNHMFEEQLFKLIDETKLELAEEEKKREEIDRKIEYLRFELQSYATSLQGFQKRTGQEQAEIDWKKLIDCKDPHKKQIIRIMEQLGGIARPNQLTDILYNNGFIKSKKRSNAYLIVYGNLVDLVEAGIIEKIGTGEYKFTNSN